MNVKFFLPVLLCVCITKDITIFAQTLKPAAYYFSIAGNDNNDGTKAHPLKTINRLNAIHFKAGDSILLKGGDVFEGTIIINQGARGTEIKPVQITSYGKGRAIINPGLETAIHINQSAFINIQNIICNGAGRVNGRTQNGISVNHSEHIKIRNIDVRGFQKSGILIYCSSYAHIENVYTHSNGFAGIFVSGDSGKANCGNITIQNCHAENNPGDPTELNNHSGNGILAGFCKNVLIDHSTANNNGWDMPRIGNGPVGIWCYEADSVVIQHCLSYKNKTSKGGEDGGGFDLDGGTTHSIIQYCLSYENQGSAFGIFQYAGASNWHDNTIRFCISINDGNISSAHAAAYIWNGSQDSTQFKNLLFYNNTIYNNKSAAISYHAESKHVNFKFFNNIFVAANALIKGEYGNDVFLGNDWWSLKNKFSMHGNFDFQNWCVENDKEQLKGSLAGLNVLPYFKNANHTILSNANKLVQFDNFKITGPPAATQSALDLQSLFKIDMGKEDFNGEPVNKNCQGACTHQE